MQSNARWNCWFNFRQIKVPTISNRIKANPVENKSFSNCDFWCSIGHGSDKLLIHFSWLFDIDFRIHNLRFAIIQNANGFDAAIVVIVVVACCMLHAASYLTNNKRAPHYGILLIRILFHWIDEYEMMYHSSIKCLHLHQVSTSQEHNRRCKQIKLKATTKKMIYLWLQVQRNVCLAEIDPSHRQHLCIL